MPYIDKSYYDNEYKGVPIDDESTFSRLEARASDIIDQITRNVLCGLELSQFAELIQTNVKKAVASQVEYMFQSGGETVIHGGSPSSVSIGNFSYSEKTNGSNGVVSPATINYLTSVGLLYRGVSVL